MNCAEPPVYGGKPMPMIEPMLASAVDVRHALVEALLGLQRLGEQHPVDHVLQRELGACRT